MEAVKFNPFQLQYASKELQNNYDIVLLAVKNNGNVLKYASIELKENFNIGLEAIKMSFTDLYISYKLKNNPKFILELIKQVCVSAINFASQDLLNNKLFLIECYKTKNNVADFNPFIKEFNNLENNIFNDNFIE